MQFMTFLTALAHSTEPLLAYVDPGLISVAIQAFFLLLFGAAATYITAPWRWFVSAFHRKTDAVDGKDSQSKPEEDSAAEDS